MRRFGELVLRFRVVFLISITALTVAFLIYVPGLEIEDDERTWFARGDRTLKEYEIFLDEFSSDQLIFVAYESEEPLSVPELKYLSHLTGRLEGVPHADEALSLTTVTDMVGSENSLRIASLVKEAPSNEAELKALQDRIDKNPFVVGNLISDDERTLGIAVRLEQDSDLSDPEISKAINEGVKAILTEESERTGRRFYSGGGVITDVEVTGILQRDIGKFFPLALLVTGLLLFVIFRSLPSLLFPLLAVFLGLVWTLGLKGMLASPVTPVSTTLFALVTVISVANSVHLISHFHIVLPRLRDVREALLATYERAGKPCLFTSLTTAIGFGSLAVSSIPGIRNLGLFSAFGIMSAFFLSMTLVPFGLLIIGERSVRSVEHRYMDKLLAAIARFNLNHHVAVLILGVAIVIGMGTGMFSISTEGSMLEYFKRGSEFRKSAEFLDERLAGISSTEIVIRGEKDQFKDPALLSQIDRLQESLTKNQQVSTSYSLVTYIKLINRALHDDDPAYYTIPPTSREVAQSLLLYELSGGSGIRDYAARDYSAVRVSLRTKQMNQEERKALIEKIESFGLSTLRDYGVEVTGWDYLVHKVTQSIVLTQVQSFGLALAVITALMVLLFGLKGGLLSIFPNVLPVVFALGLMGHAGFSLNIATAIIASIAIGIVVDDTIHYFSHFRYEFRESGDAKQAMAAALGSVGKALCFTSLILVLGFAIFLSSESGILAQYGILSGVAVATALVGDLFIGPVLLSRIDVFSKQGSVDSTEAH